jgi:hypothetical protein
LRVVVPRTREQGMPDARCTRGLACKTGSENAHEHTGSAENIRHSLRNGFTAYTRSPRRRIRLVTVVGELTAYPRPVGSTRLRQLDTSNGCRNHTTSPYATSPFVCTPFDRSRVWLNPEPALQFTCAPAPPRPPHPIPTFGDDGQRPFLGDRMAGVLKVICPTAKVEICPSGCFVAAGGYRSAGRRVGNA